MDYAAEVVEAAQRLHIRPSAVQTFLDAGLGKRADGIERRVHAMIKPIGSACNLACTYCYYSSKTKLLESGQAQCIRLDLLERFIVEYIAAQDVEEIAFTWHGGEPTLAGLSFFRRVLEIQRANTPAGRRISNDLQTNGVLLDDEWCKFLADNDFLVGLSLDGPRHLHDRYRRDKNGNSTFDAAFAAAVRLKRYRIPFATLTTVHRTNVGAPLQVYRFLRDQVGTRYMQLLPCVEPRQFEFAAATALSPTDLVDLTSPRARHTHALSAVTEFSICATNWGEFLSAIFDEWYEQDQTRVKINLFESLLAQRRGQAAVTCSSSAICGKNVVVEADGRVYSCDHFVYPEHQIGTLGERTFGEMVFSLKQLEFGLAKFSERAAECGHCRFYSLCGGECPRTRVLKSRTGVGRLSYLCSGWRQFLAHVQERLEH